MGNKINNFRFFALLKTGIFILLAAVTFNSYAAYVVVNAGPGPNPAPKPIAEVIWVPGHYHHHHWIPEHYIEFVPVAPGPSYVWVHGHWNHHHHWVRGYWRQR